MCSFNLAVSALISSAFASFTLAHPLDSLDVPTLELSGKYEPLMPPQEIEMKQKGDTIKVSLHYDIVKYVGPSYTTTIKAFNGVAPAPTIRVKPGYELEVKFYNDLEFETGTDGHNSFRLPNTTNLHTHGPHISGEEPGDYIFHRVNPQEKLTYKYEFGKNHMPGTFWYHPHFHGSTALQVGQGAAGLFFVEEDDSDELFEIPSMIKNMPQVDMVLQHMDQFFLELTATSSGDTTWSEGDDQFLVTNTTTDRTDLMLVNMQYIPKVTMDAGKWYRWRMVLSSVIRSLALRTELENSGCEFHLLAKDGIFLTDAPREVPGIILSPGNRADVAVRCNLAGEHKLVSETDTFSSDFYEDGVEIMVLDVIDTNPIEPLNVRRPCYLVDLSAETPASSKEITMTQNFPFPDDVNGIPWVNEETYIDDPYEIGTVRDTEFLSAGYHPYHQHVNPFQVVAIDLSNTAADSTSEWEETWYQVGDWHDTFMHSTNGATATLRWQADQFPGHMVLHCHILLHEDTGMMAQYDLQGKEGTTWDGAGDVDPTCIAPDGKTVDVKKSKSLRTSDLFTRN